MTYDYVCRGCGHKKELSRHFPDDNLRHILVAVDSGDEAFAVCGFYRRDWSSININTVNLRSAR